MTQREYIATFSKMSGQIIAVMSMIDFSVTLTIAYHFAKEKRKDDLLAVLLERIQSFESKKQILNVMIDKHYKKFKEDNPTLIGDLGKMQTLRNIFAHSQIEVPENVNEFQAAPYHDIGLSKTDTYASDKVRKFIIYTAKEHHENVKLLNGILVAIQKLSEETNK